MWKRENESIDKLINFILKKETEKIGLLPFLIRKRSPISISNRSDIMCVPDWRERLYAIKKLGFPIYLETKLNKDYRDLADIFDKGKDTIYQTVTGYNNKYEGDNLLSADEKIEAAKWFNEQGFHHHLAVNPFMPDKCTAADIKRMIDYVKPHGFIMRDYHRPSSGLAKKYFQKEYPKEAMKAARDEIRAFCRGNNIDHDIDLYGEDTPFYAENNLRVSDNERSFGGMSFVKQALAIYVQKVIDENNYDWLEISLEGVLKYFNKQISWFKECIIKHSEYNISTGGAYKKPEKEQFDIIYFITLLHNNRWFRDIFDRLKEKDENGNLVYLRLKGGFMRGLEGDKK
jgi:DNA repair photolyase